MMALRKHHRSENKLATNEDLPRWTERLPLSVLLHICTWLDQYSVTQLQSACRGWHSIPAERMERLWKQLYVRDFEEESTHDEVIATEGPSTAWSKRYRLRMAVEFRKHHSSVLLQ